MASSNADLKKLVVYRYHDGALSPNPWKVVIFLYELDLPWEMRLLNRADPDIRTKEPLVSITPNGRMPAFEDPNTGVKLWESGAIIEYILDVYDKEHRLSYTSSPEKYEEGCWKHFQMSGQGPYFGQLSWFLHLHHETIPSAQSRYIEETKRILGVIDSHLTRQNRLYLVGEKLSFADLMFVPWNELVPMFLLGPSFEAEWKEKFPQCWDWHQRLKERESVRKARVFALESAKSKPGAEVDAQKTAPK